jgi:hypothetical protein
MGRGGYGIATSRKPCAYRTVHRNPLQRGGRSPRRYGWPGLLLARRHLAWEARPPNNTTATEWIKEQAPRCRVREASPSWMRQPEFVTPGKEEDPGGVSPGQRRRVSRRPPKSPRRRTRPIIHSPPAEVEKPQVGTKPANHRARFSSGSRSWVFDGLSVRSRVDA